VRENEKIDFCVVNGENASFITGISEELAEELFSAGADAITGGNHTMHNTRAYNYLDDKREILRPINFGDAAPGHGFAIIDGAGFRVLVINALGCVHIEPNLDSPFPFIDKVLKETDGKYDFSVLDFHAEATGEKLAVGHAYDGKISVIFGTHTHVPTADECVLPNGTGYITDVGMCGESGGILGMDKETVVLRMKTHLPHKFKASDGAPYANAVIFDIDNSTKHCTSVKRIIF
jgi:metallophosphoesterase (TIGR00282 family)